MQKSEVTQSVYDMKLAIALAGLEIPQRSKSFQNKDEVFNWILARPAESDVNEISSKTPQDVVQNDFEKNKTDSDYMLDLEKTAKRANDMIANKKADPDVPRIGKLFAEYLGQIASESSHLRAIDNRSRPDLKARARLFYEAKTMIESVSCDTNLEKYRIAVICALGKKDRENDWGWGSNWSDNIHRRVTAEVRSEIISFISQLHSFLYT